MDIQVQFEDITTVKKRLRVEVPASTALEELNRIADQYRKSARLPGFRPGKAPVSLVKRHFQKSIRTDVLQKLIPDSYQQAIREQGCEPIGQPNLENLVFEEGHPLVYEAHIEVRPEIELPDYKGLKVQAEAKPITEEDVENSLKELSEKHSRLVSVEDQPIGDGSYAVIDLRGEYQDEEDAEGRQPFEEEGVVVQIGDEHTHQAFNEGLKGAVIGEQREFEVDYAEDYPEQKLAGHRLHFAVRVTDIKKKELPELNDDFAKDLDVETLEDLRANVRERLLSDREKNRDAELADKVLAKLVQETSFEVPEVLMEERIDSMLREVAYKMAAQGMDPSKANVDWMKVRTEFRGDAEKQVRASLLLAEIGRREKVEVSEQAIEEEVQRMADSMEQPKEKVRQYLQKEGRLEALKTRLIRAEVLKLLLESAKVLEG